MRDVLHAHGRLAVAVLALSSHATGQFQPARAADLNSASAPEIRLSGPILGYIADRDGRTVRPLNGVTGAAVLGLPLGAGSDWRPVAISPERDSIIGSDGASLFVLRISGAFGTASRLAIADGAVDLAVFGPLGRSAAILNSALPRLRVVTGLPDRPAPSREIDLPGLSGALAVSDDGEAVLLGTGEAIYLLTREGPPRVIHSGIQAVSIEFLAGRPDAVVADRRQSAVWLVRNVTRAPEWVQVAGNQDGIAEPSALGVSRDGRYLVVASAKTISMVELASRAVVAVACGCQVGRLQRLAGNAVFALDQDAEGGLLVFDGDAPEPRMVSVPPPARDSSSIAQGLSTKVAR